MPVIDLGVNFDDVKDMDKFVVVPNGTYDFQIKAIEQKTAGPDAKTPGRPMLKWTLGIKDPASGQDVNLWHNTVLPYNGPAGMVVSGLGMLVSVCKAVGLPWSGGGIATEDYVGRVGRVKVKQKTKQIKGPDGKYVNDPEGEQINEIEKFEYTDTF